MALTRKERIGLMAARRASLDVKATEAALDGKAPTVHGHAISDVSGLQTALDGKQPAGSYVLTVNYSWDALPGKPSAFPPSAHGHVVADVTGLQAALDSKLEAANFTWTNLSGKPTTFTPSAHTHVIADVTGLQAALDGKQPTGAYLTSITSTMVTDALGFTPYNASNPAGYISGITSGMVTTALGYTPYNATNPAGYISGITSTMVINALNYTPVQQSGFTGATGSKVYIGWLGSNLGLQVDSTNFGATWPINTKGVHYAADTSYFVNPSGDSRVFTLGVVTETTYPGSINGDYNSGYYHFGPSDGTPAGSYGHAHIIRLSADWNVQMFFPTSNTNEPLWLRRKQNGTYSAWRRMLQEDEWIGSKWFGSDGAVYAKTYYDANNGSYYVSPYGTSILNAAQFNGSIGVGQGINPTWKIITNGTNAIYLNGGGYGQAEGSWRAPMFYDSDNTAYYLNPNGTSALADLNTYGLYTGRVGIGSNVNTMNDTGSISVRGDANNAAVISFHRTGAYAINMGLGTDAVFRIGGWSAQSNCFQMDGNGNLTMLGNVTAYSDARLKKDVETISGALDMVSAMRGVRYTRIDSGQRQVGVIAQEMQEIVPEVVQTGIGDDDTLSVAYGNLVGVLIEAVKELRAEVEALKSKGNPQ